MKMKERNRGTKNKNMSRRDFMGAAAAVTAFTIVPRHIVALCDVDEKQAAGTFKRYPNAKQYRDFRKMLDKQKEIDAVIVSTPDHVHAIATITAIKMGKHVYCEKPLTHTIYEARKVAEAAREHKVATQMGIQGHSGEGIRLLCEWIWDGAIGPVREVHTWPAARQAAGAGHARLGPLARPGPL
jgi:predicted dehydrogenase